MLAVTDRRLLWLHDDAPVHRVRELRLTDLVSIQVRPPRPWRRRAQVVCVDRRGRRRSFGELAPATAAAIVRRVGEAPRATDRRSGSRILGAMNDWSLFVSFLLGVVVLAYGINLAASVA